MSIPRLNGVIRALEQGKPAFMSFVKPDIEEAIAVGASKFDGVLFEMEHIPWDGRVLRDVLQYLLNRGRMIRSGSLAPNVTPMVRIPPNGSELNQWVAKQALDCGVYGVVWPHVSTVEQAMNAVVSCRYPGPPDAPLAFPAGQRGDGPTSACRYWGLDQQTYYKRADVWPHNPEGEILVVLMIEDVAGIENLGDILREVPGIGCVLIGEGDLSQELGFPRQYDHPAVREAMDKVIARCKEAGVAVGHPHANAVNVERLIDEGYNVLFTSMTRSYAGLNRGLELSGRN